jgi:endonuclease/exonuclease/phosphatase family metal-dependent hydrolase
MKEIPSKIILTFLILFVTNIAFPQTPNIASDIENKELKILSWNIYMLPSIIKRSKQKIRAQYIAEQLQDTDYDIIVFQEAFHKKARKIISKALADAYPYHTKVLNKKGFIKSNGGVWVFCKYPMTQLKEIKFSDCNNLDCMSRKGAKLIKFEKDGMTYQIIATHLQADYPDENNQDIRTRQYQQIRQKLLIPFYREGIPQLIIGDLNTRKVNHAGYTEMLDIFEATDLSKESTDHTYITDDFATEGTIFQVVYDYILYRPNGLKISSSNYKVCDFQKSWDKQKKDLSDHYAIEGEIRIH